jgi:hypothetical protein
MMLDVVVVDSCVGGEAGYSGGASEPCKRENSRKTAEENDSKRG